VLIRAGNGANLQGRLETAVNFSRGRFIKKRAFSEYVPWPLHPKRQIGTCSLSLAFDFILL